MLRLIVTGLGMHPFRIASRDLWENVLEGSSICQLLGHAYKRSDGVTAPHQNFQLSTPDLYHISYCSTSAKDQR